MAGLRRKPFVGISIGALAQAFSGTFPLFSLYAGVMETELALSSEETSIIGTVLMLGTYFGIVGGMFLERFGPAMTYLGAGLMISGGYGGMYAAVAGEINVDFAVVVVFALLYGQGSAWGYLTCLNTNGKNFPPEDRGKVMGYLFAFFGLSSALITHLYRGLFPGPLRLLAFLSIASGVVFVLAAALNVVIVPQPPPQGSRKFIAGFVTTIGMAAYICVASILEVFTDVNVMALSIGTVFFFITYTIIPFLPVKGAGYATVDEEGNDQTEDGIPMERKQLHPTNAERPRRRKIDYTLREALGTANMWMLSIVFAITIGCNVTMVNNISFMFRALQEEGTDVAPQTSTSIAIYASFNCLGRMLTGWASDRTVHAVSRSMWLAATAALMAGNMLFLAFITPDLMIIAMVLQGIAVGGVGAQAVTITSDLYGLANFGSIFGVVIIGPALGTLGYYTLLSEAMVARFANSHGRCVDDYACYHTTFLICAASCAVATLLSVALHFNAKRKWGSQYSA